MSKILRYGVLGCGYFGAEFARAVKEQTGSELAMIYSPGESSKRLSAELACPIANTAEELINSPFVDAVIVATPNYMHKEHVLAAAKAKKHIFCEKPFALNKDDADEMVKACKASGVTLMVGHIMHFYSGIEALQKMIKSGEMGVIINAHVERTGWEHKKAEISWKKQQAKSGGHLFHHIHEIDIIQWIMGEADSVYAVGDNLGHKEEGFGDEADVLLLTMRFKNGSFATLQYGSGFRIGNHFIRINGTKKGAVINFKTAEITIKSDDGETIIPLFK
ncbi:MAG: Gfo/Idh/MocA family oxidoreductase, partial [Oscillospiraceae bacterium]